MQELVHAIYHDHEPAAAAVQALLELHIDPANICVLMKEGPDVQSYPVEHRTRAARRGAIGAALGAVGGAIMAPGLGLLAAGPVLAAIEGAISGGAVGGAFGTLSGLSVWRDVPELPHHIQSGGILIGAALGGNQTESAVMEALRQTGGDHISASTLEAAEEELRAK